MRLQSIAYVVFGLSQIIAALSSKVTPKPQPDLLSMGYPSSTLTQLQGMISTFRRSVGASGMIEPTINLNLTRALIKFLLIDKNNAWGYQDAHSLDPVPGHNYDINFDHICDNSSFLSIAAQYPGLRQLIENSQCVDLHDTYKTNGLKIVQMRMDQETKRGCLSYTKCQTVAPLTFFSYIPCSTYSVLNYSNPTASVPQKCWWSYYYAGALLDQEVFSYAFLPLNEAGRFVKSHEQKNAWLLLLLRRVPHLPLNNVPYDKGPACTTCPPGFDDCNDSLCVATSPRPTI